MYGFLVPLILYKKWKSEHEFLRILTSELSDQHSVVEDV